MKNKKKIIISSYDDLKNPYYHGGGAISVHELAKGLSKEFDVTVLTSKHKVSQQNERLNGVSYRRIGWTPDWFPPIGQLVYLFLLPWYAKKLRYDLWIESFTPPFSTAFLPIVTNKPVIGLVHFLSGEEMQKRYKLPFAAIERSGLTHYTQFIVPNSVTATKILKVVPNAKVVCIPNGVHIPSLNQTTKRKKVVLFLGRIEIAQKGLDLLLQSIAQIQNDSEWSYVIAGSGVPAEMKQLHEMITSLHLEQKVKVVGRVDGAQKDRLLSESSIVVVPSRFETLSLVSLEALAYALPLVTFAIDGLAWLPKAGVSRVRAFQVKRFASEIESLQADEKQRVAMGKSNREVATTYDWSSIITNYTQVIKELL